jgi:PAS domain S-box-containing protein
MSVSTTDLEAQLAQANARIAELEAQLQQVFEHIPLSVAMFDTQMRYLQVNQTWKRSYGLGENRDLTGQSHYDIFPEIGEGWKQIHRECLAGAINHNDEAPFPRGDGHTDWIRWDVRPWYTAQKEVGGLLMYTEVITQHKQAQDALLENQSRLASILDNIPLMVNSFDEAGKPVLWNHACETILGWSHEEVLAHPDIMSEFYPDPAVKNQVIADILLRDNIIREYTVRNRAGQDRIQLWQNIILPNGTSISIGQDITERKQAEHAIQQERDLMNQIINAIPDTIYVKDRESRFTRINQAQVAMMGQQEAAQVLGKTDLDFQEPDLAQSFMEEERQMMETGQPILNRIEYNPTPDGQARWLSASKVPLRDPNGQIIGLVGISRDISSTMQIEEALLQSQILAEQMSQLAKVGGWVLDLTTNQLTWSDETKRIHEVPASFEPDLEGAINFYAPEFRQVIQEAVGQTISSAKPFDLELQILTTTGRKVWVRALGRAKEADGKVVQIFGAFQDIDERKQVEKEQQRLIRELKAALIFKDQFLSMMSHELRTPLNAIQGYVGLALQEEGVSEDITYMLERSLSNSKRLLTLINDILDISRINANRIELVQRPLSLPKLASDWYNDFQKTAKERKVAFHLEVDPTLPQMIQADEERLAQMVGNLLQNAFKFTDQGSVTLSLKRKNDHEMTINIADTGIGISDTWHHLIFEEFRQVDSSSRRKYGGSGLGLSIVQKLAQLMSGTVTLNSKLGEGSTFTLTLPIIIPPPSEAIGN